MTMEELRTADYTRYEFYSKQIKKALDCQCSKNIAILLSAVYAVCTKGTLTAEDIIDIDCWAKHNGFLSTTSLTQMILAMSKGMATERQMMLVFNFLSDKLTQICSVYSAGEIKNIYEVLDKLETNTGLPTKLNLGQKTLIRAFSTAPVYGSTTDPYADRSTISYYAEGYYKIRTTSDKFIEHSEVVKKKNMIVFKSDEWSMASFVRTQLRYMIQYTVQIKEEETLSTALKLLNCEALLLDQPEDFNLSEQIN